MIKDNIAKIKAEIGCGVKLVAVTKNRSIQDIKEVVAAGATDLGENRVQEFLEKYPHFENVSWHLIGTLQKNKVKYVVGKVALIHSVDSVALAQEIAKRSVQAGAATDILMQVNTAKEASKHGFYEEDLFAAMDEIGRMEGIRVRGLMMIAPDTPDDAYLKELFAKTKNIFDEMMKFNDVYGNINIDILSMGMSHDYRIAVACGANMVRIGRSLFV
jgi:pyridoxal phosphate enzyme (YggS family)